MNTVRIVAMVLMGAGLLGLLYGGFSYTRQTSTTELGPITLSVQERQRVNVPVWAGVGTMVLGGGLLLWSSRRQ
ncbi:hypothetical protein [Zobellella sp. DQSA1]|uniref:hypothetical protein n=1 Tax=Zobellella sp. DQSA1 TaxID=3342386 RepID=UPI0035BF55FF